ncbi:tetratricopeptide repeat protein [Pontixanthobacter aquaemixtae]|uniref:Tetratricopeptide repeat protein n=1 Tax=Pontixanthobacter aquaemixtae TaxID=1958940 RepID=A0A844ZQ33_9SPHN|nr:tetratricopeptide repeat protein [Pontixanthobacter aquaemixtae]MXO89848.1 tetratricopeptide repeat protein [Pontixanthobacter aquaemixtae]
MSWLPILILALAAFVIAAWLLHLPKSGWALFGAALVFGLAGYALQGSPGYAGAPTENAPVASANSEAIVEARRDFFGRDRVPSRWVTVADGFARNGQFEDSANMLRNAVDENPDDIEAWVALGNALIEHANGSLTPAALYAFAEAEKVQPGHPAPAYFLGVGLLRSGKPMETRAIWAELLENAPEGAEWAAPLQDRLTRLDELLAQMGGPVPVVEQ